MLTGADFPDDPAYLAYLAARRVWPIRHELTPRGREQAAKGDEDPVTWADWYQEKFGRPLEEARREYIAIGRRGRPPAL